MNLIRLTAYALLAQAALIGVASAIPVAAPEPASLSLLTVAIGGVAVSQVFRKRK